MAPQTFTGSGRTRLNLAIDLKTISQTTLRALRRELGRVRTTQSRQYLLMRATMDVQKAFIADLEYVRETQASLVCSMENITELMRRDTTRQEVLALSATVATTQSHVTNIATSLARLGDYLDTTRETMAVARNSLNRQLHAKQELH